MIVNNDKEYVCLLDFGMDFVRGKWKSVLLCELYSGPKRFSELNRLISNVSQKVLTENLKELEKDKLITKIVYPEVPPKVEYLLTPMGEDLTRIIKEVENWSYKYFSHLIDE